MATATATKSTITTTPAVGDRVIVISSKGHEKLAVVTAVHEPRPVRETPKYDVLLDEVRAFYTSRDLDPERIGGYANEQPEDIPGEDFYRLSVTAYGPTGHVCGYSALAPATGADGEVHVWKPIS